MSVSTFTVQDASGRLKSILAQRGYLQVKYLTQSPTFHIQVVASTGSVNSTFDIDSEQVKKVTNEVFQINNAIVNPALSKNPIANAYL